MNSLENGREAISILNKNNIDLMLMDIHMPVLDGLETAKAIRSSTEPYKDIPIIMVTADEAYHKRIPIFYDAVIGKPVNKQALFDTIEKTIEKPRRREGEVKPLFAS